MRKTRRAHADDVNIALNRNDHALVMRRDPGLVLVVKAGTLVKQRRFRRVQIFGRHVLVQSPPAKGDDAAAPVADRKHDAVAETVIGHGDVLAMDQHARLDHGFGAGVPARQPVAQGVALIGGVTEAELLLHGGGQAPVRQIAARPGTGLLLELGLKKLRAELKHLVQPGALFVLFVVFLRGDRQRHTRLARQPLHRVAERQALRFHYKAENIAVFAGRKIEPCGFLVIDEEGRGFLRPERRQPLPLPPRLRQFYARADDIRHRQPGLDLVEELGREAHEGYMSAAGALSNQHAVLASAAKQSRGDRRDSGLLRFARKDD